MTDPENGDFQPGPGSPATDYGCRTFTRNPYSQAPTSINTHTWLNKAPLFNRTIEVSGSINSNTLWDVDTVRVIGDITIENGVTLSVNPGVHVTFDDHFGVYVQGTLFAVGTVDRPIRWTSSHPEAFAIDSTITGSWFGFRFDNTSAINDSSQFEYCIIEYCKAAGDGSRGGALSLIGFSKLRVVNCVFQHNVADHGAVAYCANFSAPTFCGCLMVDNHAFVTASAIYCLDAYPALINNTIINNPVHNEDEWAWAGIIHNHISKSRIVNCIIRDNFMTYLFGGPIFEGKFHYITFNNIEDNHPGEGNFDTNPEFVGGGIHPYSLSADSPCINTGIPDIDGLPLPDFDLAGTPRVQSGRIDVGAYEGTLISHSPNPEESGPDFALSPFPNPSFGEMSISFTIHTSGPVKLEIYSGNGRRIATLLDRDISSGRHTVSWDGKNRDGRRLVPGLYFCRLTSLETAGSTGQSGKILLIR